MALALEDVLIGSRTTRWAWKPLLRRYLTASWAPLRMRPGPAAFPAALRQMGIYLHVPFCRRPCGYCPYNRVAYDAALYETFEQAAHQEIDLVASAMADARRPAHAPPPAITSLYVGGGTPTIVPESLARLLAHAGEAFGPPEDIGVELHPAAADDQCLDVLQQSGVTMVSVGVESLSDRLLRLIGRSHDGTTAHQTLRRVVARGFATTSADLMFALPTQTLEELDQTLAGVLALGVDQISCYPIFSFPFTELGRQMRLRQIRRPPAGLIREMLRLIRRRAGESGLVQNAVWSFGRPCIKKFTSTTRHHYLGIGPSAASMMPGQFRVNTFSIDEYAATLPGRLPTALVMPVERQLEMTYWLYWRAYEMRIPQARFRETFGQELESVYGPLMALSQRLGMTRLVDGAYCLTEKSAYWIHRVQNEYALNYINRLWGQCRREAWPQTVRL